MSKTFWVSLLILFGVALLGAGAGATITMRQIRIDCIQTGSALLDTTFSSCEPTAALINGEMVPFKAVHREELGNITPQFSSRHTMEPVK